MTKAQIDAVVALRRDIDRVDRVGRGRVARGRTGRRCFKVWDVTVRVDGTVVVKSVVGWRRAGLRPASHPFDDITRVVTVGRRGGLSGWGNVGHGIAGETGECRGPRMMYRIDAQRVY